MAEMHNLERMAAILADAIAARADYCFIVADYDLSK